LRNPSEVEKIGKDEKVLNFSYFSNQQRKSLNGYPFNQKKLSTPAMAQASGLTIDEYCKQNGLSSNWH